MAKIQFLTILLTVTCFLGGFVSVTDKEFEVSTVQWLQILTILLTVICLLGGVEPSLTRNLR